jgi:hypothetical protein
VEFIMQLNVREAHQLVVRIMCALGHAAADGKPDRRPPDRLRVRMPFDRSRWDRARRLTEDPIDVPDVLFE